MRALVGAALLGVVLCACSGGLLQADSGTLECPAQTGPFPIGGFGPLPVSFEVALPDHGVSWNSGGEWILGVLPSEPARLTVVVTVEPDVVLESLSFGVQSLQGRMLWESPAGTHLPEGAHEFGFHVDGSDLPHGRYSVVAAVEIEHDNRDPCRYGDRSETSLTASLGYLDIGFPRTQTTATSGLPHL